MKSMLTRQRSDEAKELRKRIGDHVPFSLKEPRIRDDDLSNTVTTLISKDNQIIEVYETSI